MSACGDGFDQFYLGLPGQMEALDPDVGLKITLDDGTVLHQLADAGNTVTRRRIPKRNYSLPLAGLDRDAAQQILAWSMRLYGPGPFLLVDPTMRNQLGYDASVGNPAAGYSIPAGQALAYDQVAPPAQGGHVVDWTGGAVGSVLVVDSQAGQGAAGAGDVNPLYACPHLPDEATTVSIWLAAPDGPMTVDLRASGRDGDGTDGVDVAESCVLTPGLQRYDVTADPGALGGSKFAALTVKITAAGAPSTVRFWQPQLEYGFDTGPWTLGLGVPRILIGGQPEATVSARVGFTDRALTLAEVG